MSTLSFNYRFLILLLINGVPEERSLAAKMQESLTFLDWPFVASNPEKGDSGI